MKRLIQDGGLIRKCALTRPKCACTAGYLSLVHMFQILTVHVLQVGVKGDCKNFNRGLDCDVLVAEVCSCS